MTWRRRSGRQSMTLTQCPVGNGMLRARSMWRSTLGSAEVSKFIQGITCSRSELHRHSEVQNKRAITTAVRNVETTDCERLPTGGMCPQCSPYLFLTRTCGIFLSPFMSCAQKLIENIDWLFSPLVLTDLPPGNICAKTKEHSLCSRLNSFFFLHKCKKFPFTAFSCPFQCHC